MDTSMWIGFAVVVVLILIFGKGRKGGPDHMDGDDGDMD